MEITNRNLSDEKIINEIQIIIGPEFVFDYELSLKGTDLYIESLSEIYFKYRPITTYKYSKLTEQIMNFRLDSIRDLWFVENAEHTRIEGTGNYIRIKINKYNDYILK